MSCISARSAGGMSGTPSATALPPLSVGRDPCVPPRHTHFRRGTRAPPYRAQAVSGRTESSAPTAGQGAVRNGTSYPKGICSAALHCGTPSPTGGSPYPSVGRDPCVPPRHTHFRRDTRAPPYRVQRSRGGTGVLCVRRGGLTRAGHKRCAFIVPSGAPAAPYK